MFKKTNREKTIEELISEVFEYCDKQNIKRRKGDVYPLYLNYYLKILNKQINGCTYNGKEYKIIDVDRNDDANTVYILIKGINGEIKNISMDIYDISTDRYHKHTSLKWYLQYYWNKIIFNKFIYNIISKRYNNEINKIINNANNLSIKNTSQENCPKEFNNEINNILYNACSLDSLPKEKESLKDKIKWFGHNLFHCKCSDKDESCDADINEIIKNNSLEQIEKDTKSLYNNPNWDKENLVLYVPNREVLKEIDIRDRRQGRIGD